MTRRFTSTASTPHERGLELGKAHAAQVAHTVRSYRSLFDRTAGRAVDIDEPGARALDAVRGWAPELAAEIEGIALGAGLPVEHVAAVNARTEILATLQPAAKGECSAVVLLGDDGQAPVAVQTWDWFSGMAGNWFTWTIPHQDGRVTTTVTEYGIVGKIGVSSSGIGALFTILHHEDDGRRIGVPVHVVARRVLDDARDVNEALMLLASADVSASSSITVVAAGATGKTALTAELHPGGPAWVLPDSDGALVHTNHFLTQPAALKDTEPRTYPDTLVRYDVLRRGLRRHAARPRLDDVLAVMDSHLGGGGAVCCHPVARGGAAADAPDAEDTAWEYATLATVSLDVPAGQVSVLAGGPCGR